MVACMLPQARAEENAEEDPYKARRHAMVNDIAKDRAFGRDPVENEAVLAAMRTVPRHALVPDNLKSRAYTDSPLPIGYGQTISQPYIVALMTDLIEPEKDDVILEVGTGSGYQAAVLSRIVEKVYTIEIVPALAKSATKDLEALGYDNIETKQGDGYFGWEEHAPYDGIVVTAAASHIPPPLIEQLKPGAKMVIPVGPPLQVQQLMIVGKKEDGTTVKRSLMPVRFVPLTRGEKE